MLELVIGGQMCRALGQSVDEEFAIVSMLKLCMELWLVRYPFDAVRIAGCKITKRHPYLAKTWNKMIARFKQFLFLKPLYWQQFSYDFSEVK